MADPSRSGLATLPPELLAEISSHLCWHCQMKRSRDPRIDTSWLVASNYFIWNRPRETTPQPLQALRNLAQTCRRLRAAAQPFLYHDLHTYIGSVLYQFCRTLSERPDLRPKVTHVTVSHGGLDGMHPLPDSWTLDSLLIRAGLRTALPEGHEARDGAEYSDLLSLLLQLTPNLASAHFHMPTRTDRSFPTPAFLGASKKASMRLTRLILSGNRGPGREVRFELDEAAHIIRLAPNLEFLQLHKFVGATAQFHKNLGGNSLQNLAELTLTDTRLAVDSLRNLLAVAGPRLSKFCIWILAGGRMTADDGAEIEFTDVLTALQPWTQTLRELGFMAYVDGFPRPANALRDLSLLRDFRVLENLVVEAICLDFWGQLQPNREALVSILPASVREIEVLGYADVQPALQTLLAAFQDGQYPSLNEIIIRDQEPGLEGEERQMEELGVAFRSAGVNWIEK